MGGTSPPFPALQSFRANMDTSNGVETDLLQVSSNTNGDRLLRRLGALAVIQTAAKAISESDSSLRARGRSRSIGSGRSAGAVALGSRHARTPSPYARIKAKPAIPPTSSLRCYRLLPTLARSRKLWRIRSAFPCL